jgi:putative ABC transport system permease protein
MNFYLSALLSGLALCSLGWGIYLSLRIFNIPDITTDGSYTLGAAITAACLMAGLSWPLAIALSLAGGALAGMTTGLIHTRLQVNPLLAGILVMTAAYSFNLAIMGRSNIPLIQTDHLFLNSGTSGSGAFILVLLVMAVLATILVYLLTSDFGLAMRATGNSPDMAACMGVNVNRMKVFGLALANALTALSGSIVAQQQLFADINMGIGIVIFGLGAVIMGETLMDLLGKRSVLWRIVGVVLGCLIFRLVIAFSLASGIDPNWLKAITAAFVLVFVSIPRLRKNMFRA